MREKLHLVEKGGFAGISQSQDQDVECLVF